MGAFSPGGFKRSNSIFNPSNDGFSPIQLATLAAAATEPDSGDTIFDRIKHGAGVGFGWVFDKLLRPSYGYWAGLEAALKEDSFDDAVGAFATNFGKGFMGERKIGFGEILEQNGILEDNDFLRGLAGFAGDVVFDPLNALTLGSARLATSGGKVISKGSGLYDAVLAGRAVIKGSETADDARRYLKILEETDETFSARKALARFDADEFIPKREAGALGDSDVIMRQSLEKLAATEEGLNTVKAFQARLGVPFTRRSIPLTPASIGGKYIPLPTLAKTAQGKGVLGKVPLVPSVSQGVGNLFVPGFQDDLFHAGEINAKKVVQIQTDKLLHSYRPLAEAGADLGDDAIMHALHLGETTKGIVKDGVLDDSVVRGLVAESKISPQQADFLARWHDFTGVLRKEDEAFGISYDKPGGVGAGAEGVIYVPHVYSTAGEKLGAGHPIYESYLKQFGFTKERAGLTNVEQLAKLKASGAVKRGVETDPMKLMISRIRSGALNQANTNMLNAFVKAYGREYRVMDPKKIARVTSAVAKSQSRIDALETITDRGRKNITTRVRRRVNARRTKALAKSKPVHEKRIADAKAQVDKWSAEVRKLSRFRRPSVTKAAREEQATLAGKVDAVRKLIAHLDDNAVSLDNFIDVESGLERIFAGATKPKKMSWVEYGKRELPKLEKKLAAATKNIEERDFLGAADKVHKEWLEHSRELHEFVGYAKARGQLSSADEAALRALLPDKIDMGRYKSLVSYVEKKYLPDFDAGIKAMEDEVQRILNKAKRAHTKDKTWASMQLNRAQSALDKAQTEWTELQDRIHAQYEDIFNRTVFNEIDEKQVRQMDIFEKEIDRLARLEKRGLTSPAEYDQLMEDVIAMPGTGKEYLLPHEVAAGITRVRSVITRDDVVRELANTYDKYMAKWKTAVTVVNPGYRVRNTLSDFWGMWVAGVPSWAIVRYGGEAAVWLRTAGVAEQKIARGIKLTSKERKAYEEFLRAHSEGIFSGLFQGDVNTIAHSLQAGGHGSVYFLKKGRLLKGGVQAAQTANRHAENWGRATHYLYRRRFMDLSVSEASRWVRKAHFDYEDVTDFERKVMKRLLPFYTWSRKNIPFQLEMLVSRPGRFSAFPKFINEMETASGDSSEDIVPDFIRKSMGFKLPIGGGTYLLPQIGAADLRLLEYPEQFKGMLTPSIRFPLELITGRSLTTGADIQGVHPRSPLSNFGAAVLGRIPGNPLNVGPTERTVDGEQIDGPGASPWVSWLASQTPITNLIFNSTSEIRKVQRGSDNLAPLAWAGGVSLFRPDADQELAIRLLDFNERMQRNIRGLRDEDVLAESDPSTPSAFQQTLEMLIRRSAERG